MNIDLYQVDAFASKVFEGNPAAVCPLHEWLADDILLKIAMENNLSETAFFVEQGDGYKLRWFTPVAEVDLCGHATLASAHVLFEHLGYEREKILFYSNSGELRVKKEDPELVMDFPKTPADKTTPPETLLKGLGLELETEEVYRSVDYMVVMDSQAGVAALDPDYHLLKKLDTRGIIATAPADHQDTDFVSRFFAPALGIDEDPVTGSAHTMLAPYWAERLAKDTLRARQLSSRGGEVLCRVSNERVELSGRAVTYLEGTIEV